MISFIAHGPGSANALLPIINKLKNKIDVNLIALHPFVSQLWGCEISSEKEYYESFNISHLIVYGTGSGNELEINVSSLARASNIKSISVLDLFWFSEENLKMRFPVAPDVIITPDFISSCRVESELDSVVLGLGNPHFDRLKKYDRSGLNKNKENLKVAFVSQCSGTGDSSDTMEEGKEALKSLIELMHTTNIIESITLCPHPREDTTWLNKMANKHNLNFSLHESFKECLQSDLVVGVNCTLQYECKIIGIPTVFYKSKNQLVTQIRLTTSIQHIWDYGATDKVSKFIQSYYKEIKAEDSYGFRKIGDAQNY